MDIMIFCLITVNITFEEHIVMLLIKVMLFISFTWKKLFHICFLVGITSILFLTCIVYKIDNMQCIKK